MRYLNKQFVVAALSAAFANVHASDVSQFNDLRKSALAKMPASELIVFKATTPKPKHVVHVFTDVDCGYCRRFHQNIAQYSALGIEVRYLWYPLAGIDGESARKAKALWCEVDRPQAMNAAMAGVDPGAKQCANPIAKQYELAQAFGVQGTPNAIAADGSMLNIEAPAEFLQALDRLAVR